VRVRAAARSTLRRSTHIGPVGIHSVHQRKLLAVKRDRAVEAGQKQRDARAVEHHVVARVPAHGQERKANARARRSLKAWPQRHNGHQGWVVMLTDATQHIACAKGVRVVSQRGWGSARESLPHRGTCFTQRVTGVPADSFVAF
jgi:hypothetical protein